MKSQIFISLTFLFIINIYQNEIPLYEYETKHFVVMQNNSTKCTLFLKKDSPFPLKEPRKVILIGTGARLTTKGDTGSRDVKSDISQSMMKV